MALLRIGTSISAIQGLVQRRFKMSASRPPVLLLGWVIVCGCITLETGCTGKPPGAPMIGNSNASGSAQRRITREELSQRLMAFADRYLARISEATDKLKRDAKDPTVRRAAHATKYFPGTAVLTFAVEPDPVAGMLDMLTVVTLERMVWHDTGWAIEVFGPEGAEVLRKAQVEAENDIWSCAAEVFPPERLRDVRQVIEDWKRDHPGNRYVSTMRFDDFTTDGGERARRAAAAARSASGGFLAPINEATRAVDETRLWGERFIFLTGRMQRMMSWQAELLVYELAITPEVQQTMANHLMMSEAMQRFAVAVEAWPDDLARERQALLKDFDGHAGETGELVTNIRAALAEAQPVAEDVRRTTESAVIVATELHAVLRDAKPVLEEIARLSGKSAAPTSVVAAPAAAPVVAARATGAEPIPAGASLSGATPTGELAAPAVQIDIAPPSAAADGVAPPNAPAGSAATRFNVQEYESLVREMHALVEATNSLLESQAWVTRLNEVNSAAETRVAHAGREGRELINYGFYRGMFFALFCAVLLFVTALLYRFTVRRLSARPSPQAAPALQNANTVT